jgi:hypothetical protein
LKIDLAPLRDLAGFLGAAVIDSETGLILGHLGGDLQTLEAAAAGNTDVVRAARRMAASLDLQDDLEDLAVCLFTQFHLVRAIDRNPAILIYVMLDRRNANLAGARLALKQVEQAIEI